MVWRSTPRCAGPCSPARASGRRRARQRSRQSASRTTLQQASKAGRSGTGEHPTAECRAEAWHKVIEQEGLPNQTVDAVAQGFVRVHDTALLTPYIEKYHAMLTTLWASRTHAIAESVVEGFYPVTLANRELVDASQSWLDANPDAKARH